MNTIPTSVTEEQVEQHIRPYLKTAKRGFEYKTPLYKVGKYLYNATKVVEQVQVVDSG